VLRQHDDAALDHRLITTVCTAAKACTHVLLGVRVRVGVTDGVRVRVPVFEGVREGVGVRVLQGRIASIDTGREQQRVVSHMQASLSWQCKPDVVTLTHRVPVGVPVRVRVTETDGVRDRVGVGVGVRDLRRQAAARSVGRAPTCNR